MSFVNPLLLKIKKHIPDWPAYLRVYQTAANAFEKYEDEVRKAEEEEWNQMDLDHDHHLVDNEGGGGAKNESQSFPSATDPRPSVQWRRKQRQYQLLEQVLPRDIRQVEWLMDVSAFIQCVPEATVATLQEWIHDMIDHHHRMILMTRHRDGRISPGSRSLPVTMRLAFDLAPILPLHLPLPVPEGPPDWIKKIQEEERLLTRDELHDLTGSLAESVPDIHWQWIRYMAEQLYYPPPLDQLTVARVYTSGMPLTDKAYQTLLTDVCHYLERARPDVREELRHMQKSLPDPSQWPRVLRRLAASIVAQRLPFVGRFTSDVIKIQPKAESFFAAKARPSMESNNTPARKKKANHNGFLLPPPSSPVSPLLAKSNSALFVEAPDLFGSGLSSSTSSLSSSHEKPRGELFAGESLGYLFSLLWRALEQDKKNVAAIHKATILVCPRDDALALIMAAMIVKYIPFGGGGGAATTAFRLPEQRCYLWNGEQGGGGGGLLESPWPWYGPLLDLGIFFNSLMDLCHDDLLDSSSSSEHHHLSGAMQTWVMTALVSQKQENFEHYLWQQQRPVNKPHIKNVNLFHPPPAVGDGIKSGQLDYFNSQTAAHWLRVGLLPAILQRMDEVEPFLRQAVAHFTADDINPALPPFLFSALAIHAGPLIMRLYDLAFLRLPNTTTRERTHFLYETYANQALAVPLQRQVGPVHDLLKLLLTEQTKRFFIRLDTIPNRVPPPRSIWAVTQDGAPSLTSFRF